MTFSFIFFLLVGLPLLTFTYFTLNLLRKLITAVRAIRAAKSEGSAKRVEAGRISVMNALFGLLLVGIGAYFFFLIVLGAIGAENSI